MSKTDAITRLATAKHHETRQRVVAALDHWPTSRAMTFVKVCQAAKGSTTFLYDPHQADLTEHIRQERALTYNALAIAIIALTGADRAFTCDAPRQFTQDGDIGGDK